MSKTKQETVLKFDTLEEAEKKLYELVKSGTNFREIAKTGFDIAENIKKFNPSQISKIKAKFEPKPSSENHLDQDKSKVFALFKKNKKPTDVIIETSLSFDYVKRHKIERDVVAFATDSVCTTRKITSSSNELGQFSLDKSGDDVFFLQNGIYRVNGKWKQRGLGHLGTKEIEHLDTIEKDGKLFYKFKVLRTGQLRSSIIQNDIGNIGKFSEITRQIDLNADKKRVWLGQIQTVECRTMSESVPISLNFKSLSNV